MPRRFPRRWTAVLALIGAAGLLGGCDREPAGAGPAGDEVARTETPAAPADSAPAPAPAPTPDAGQEGPPPPITSAPGEAMSDQLPAAPGPSSPVVTVEGRNRLGDETSPYLLQHKNNPVHWWPWGPAAFAAARAADKPIFLSVGYSTCYWCHVMERESFEDEETARLMNELFVCIKVDREERPDVDDIYMMAVNVLNRGQGGWPMSVWLDPDTLKPFLAGTYFPKEDQQGRPAFRTVLRQVADFWNSQREQSVRQAEEVAKVVVEQLTQARSRRPIDVTLVQSGAEQLMAAYDATYGGFGRRPKFPIPTNVDFLIATAWENESIRAAVLHTLDRMATGGMYDQVGGGFHRYSTDEKWLVPHFEKMLYDNGQLASTYAEVYARTGDPFYAEIVRETLEYVLREMTAPGGAFLSAQDAEVNHREGENYIWTADQVRATLEAAGLSADVEFALEVYGLDDGTNFQDPHHPEDGRKNVLFLTATPGELAESRGTPPGELDERLVRINAALYAARLERDQPGTDDKILTAWNGLMIAGMADGGRVLEEPRFVEAAQRAARFVLDHMRDADGGLLRTYRGGEARINAFLEDYAYLVKGLLALHRATGDDAMLQEAIALVRLARDRFWDTSSAGYFDTLADQSDLFVRIKTTYDGATPSGNSTMASNLIDLHERTGDDSYLDDAVATLESLSSVLSERPTGSLVALTAVHRLNETSPGRLVRAERDPNRWPVTKIEQRVKFVAIFPSVPEVTLAPGETAEFVVELRLANGFHLNAREPGLDYLFPLELSIVGCNGLELEVDYPAGEAYEGPEGVMNVHHKRVKVPVRVTRVGEVTDACRLMITWQACNDQQCFRPRTESSGIRFIGSE